MKSVVSVVMVCLVCLAGLGMPAAAQGEVTVDPLIVTGTLSPGETENVQVSVSLPGSMPKGDVVFVFDTTGSMYQVLDAMKADGIMVMEQIREAIPDTRFGVASFMDYPESYTGYYGYTCKSGTEIVPCIYGDLGAGDYDYRMDEDLTGEISIASAAINRVLPGSGGDWPQDYTRVIYESQLFSWSEGAKKILVIFGDAPPHAAPNGSALAKPWGPGLVFTHTEYGAPYGGDPGRDHVAYTSDDLDYELVIRDIAEKHIAIVGVYCPEGGMEDKMHSDAENNFRYMSHVTGGAYVLSNSAGNPSEITAQVVSIIQQMSTKNVGELTLQAGEEMYRGWVASPDSYTDVPWPSASVFNVAITPPAGTPEGDYSFPLNVVGDGVVLGTVGVTVHVSGAQPEEPVEVPIDIKPGSCPNSLNVREKGVLTVAVLGSRDLKASEIDPESIVLTWGASIEGVKPIRTSLEDVASASTKTCSCGYKSGRPDRKQDLVLKFDTREIVKKFGIENGEGCIRVTITGTLKGSGPGVAGQAITGSDYLRVLDTGHGSCGKGGSKDDKGSCDGRDSCDHSDSWDKGDSCGGTGGSCDKAGSCDGGGSRDGKDPGDEGNPWDDEGPSSDHSRGNGRDSRD